MKVVPVQFLNKYKLVLRGFVHVPKKYDTAVLFLHGFPGSMFGTSERVLSIFSRLGFLGMRFEFSGVNTSEGNFSDKLMSKEVLDVKYAIDFLETNYKFKKLILVGHSTGAIDAELYGCLDKRISAMVIISGVSDLKHAVHYDFTDEQVREFWTKGYIKYNRVGKWYHNKKLKKAFYDEFFTLDVARSIKKFKKPLLIIHGDKDEAVAVSNAYELFALANQPKKLVVVNGADHRFSKWWHMLRVMWELYWFAKKS